MARGRESVAAYVAYVAYVHYVTGVHQAMAPSRHDQAATAGKSQHPHHED